MAAATAEELEVRNSTESPSTPLFAGAQSFIDWFYTAVSDRRPLANFYVNSSAKYAAAGAAADISINGRVCAQPSDFAALLDQQATGTSGSKNGANANGAASSSSTTTTTPSSALRVRYDVDGFDVHVVNPQFRLACPEQLLQQVSGQANTTQASRQQTELRQRMVSLLVQVTGHVQYGGSKDSPRGAFTEVFVLVPNWDVLAAGQRAPRGLHRHLILSQNFRAL